jgi:uncharacterized protein
VKKIRLEIITLSSSNSHVGHYALVLGEASGKRRLPIIIGAAEAQAIALELESIKTNRPMTHDLIYNMARHFDINLLEVIINDLHEGIFYARLILEVNGEVHEIDSRPSDAVAIGVRFKAPVYTYESVLAEAGIVIDEEENQPESEAEAPGFSLADIESSDPLEEPEEQKPAVRKRIVGQDRLKQLQKDLDEALGKEDYLSAARIRDEIKRMTGE